MQKHRAVAPTLVLFVVFAAGVARADQAKEPPRSGDGGHYVFDDDPLDAQGLGPLGSRIQVMARATRETLIRPRTAFVVELLKSVEKL